AETLPAVLKPPTARIGSRSPLPRNDPSKQNQAASRLRVQSVLGQLASAHSRAAPGPCDVRTCRPRNRRPSPITARAWHFVLPSVAIDKAGVFDMRPTQCCMGHGRLRIDLNSNIQVCEALALSQSSEDAGWGRGQKNQPEISNCNSAPLPLRVKTNIQVCKRPFK